MEKPEKLDTSAQVKALLELAGISTNGMAGSLFEMATEAAAIDFIIEQPKAATALTALNQSPKPHGQST